MITGHLSQLITKKTKDATKRKLGDSTATLDQDKFQRMLQAIYKTIAKPRNTNVALATKFKDWIIQLWHIGGSSDNMENLTLDNLKWGMKVPCVIQKRAKHRGTKIGMGAKTRERVKFSMGKTLKALILKRMNMANQN